MRRRFLVAALALFAACKTRLYEPDDDGGPPEDLSHPIDLAHLPDFAMPDLVPPSDCPPEAKLVYTVDADNGMLSSFRPDTRLFHDIATLACPAPGGYQPGSMAVQRDGTAWVEYSDFTRGGGSSILFSVDIKTGACDPTPHQPVGAGLNGSFGMAIALDNDVEQLYLLGPIGGMGMGDTLWRCDLATFDATPLGPVDGDGDMTGDSNGHLFAFLPDWTGATARVVDLDKTTAAPLQTWPLPTLDPYMGDVAVAAWGDMLWIFAGQGNQNGTTSVFRLDPATGNVQVAISDTGRHVVGAGVAPCKP